MSQPPAEMAAEEPVAEGTPAELPAAEPALSPLEAAASPASQGQGETAPAGGEPVGAEPPGEAEPPPAPPPPAQEGAAEATPAVAEAPPPPAPLPLPADASPEEELRWATEQLRALGYAYTDNDELRAVADGGIFRFEGQPHYERLCLAVADYVQALLRSRFGLRRHLLASDKTPVFASPDLGTRSGALVLLCGAGQVAAGQWARRLCINESLGTGTVFNYIRDAQAAGLPVLVLNPNEARSSERHCAEAWRTMLEPSAEAGFLQHVAMVAHSYGGVCTVAMLGEGAPESVLQLLRGVALTDSVHGRGIERASPESREFFSRRVVNWVTSSQPLNALVARPIYFPPAAGKRLREPAPLFQPALCDSLRLSAGTNVHESTSEACRVPAMQFLLHMLTNSGWARDEDEAGVAGAAAEAAHAPQPAAEAEA